MYDDDDASSTNFRGSSSSVHGAGSQGWLLPAAPEDGSKAQKQGPRFAPRQYSSISCSVSRQLFNQMRA